VHTDSKKLRGNDGYDALKVDFVYFKWLFNVKMSSCVVKGIWLEECSVAGAGGTLFR